MDDKGGETIARLASGERQHCQAVGSRLSMHGGRKTQGRISYHHLKDIATQGKQQGHHRKLQIVEG